MEKQTTESPITSRVAWASLEERVRGQVQTFVQQVLEEDVTEFPGRRKSQRRHVVDPGLATATGTASPASCTRSRRGTLTWRRAGCWAMSSPKGIVQKTPK